MRPRAIVVSACLVTVLLFAGTNAQSQYSLDLDADGSYTWWAGGGYASPVVPFSQGGTIETWLRPSVVTTGAERVIASSENDYWFYFRDNGSLGVRLELGAGNPQVYESPSGLVSAGNWQHVAFTYDLSTVTFFVDAVAMHSAPTAGGPIWGSHTVMFGAEANRGAFSVPNGRYVRARLDNTRVWSTVRTGPEIAATMMLDEVADPDLIAHWRWEQTDVDEVAGVLTALGGAAGYVLDTWIDIGTWTDLGNGLAGSTGTPSLVGTGALLVGSVVSLNVSSAPPFAPSTLVVGVSDLSVPFKGGVMVPNPNLMFGMTIGFLGQASLAGLWPSGIPSGFTTYFQWWVVDAGGPQGFAASNAVSGTAP